MLFNPSAVNVPSFSFVSLPIQDSFLEDASTADPACRRWHNRSRPAARSRRRFTSSTELFLVSCSPCRCNPSLTAATAPHRPMRSTPPTWTFRRPTPARPRRQRRGSSTPRWATRRRWPQCRSRRSWRWRLQGRVFYASSCVGRCGLIKVRRGGHRAPFHQCSSFAGEGWALGAWLRAPPERTRLQIKLTGLASAIDACTSRSEASCDNVCLASCLATGGLSAGVQNVG
jgi:hypothetical protein